MPLLALRSEPLPSPPDPLWPRYSNAPLPPYRFVPGRAPHPRRDPRGHSYGLLAPPVERLDPENWAHSELYRFGVDLYNFAYWWEAHEAFEALWRGAAAELPLAPFLQGLIQIAAANLKHFAGSPVAAAIAARGLLRLDAAPSRYLGIDVRGFATKVRASFENERAAPVLIELLVP